jgi:glycerol-3-phosphate acyltransferase PlsY
VETLYSIILTACAFSLGACPFSLWVGKWATGKDIRNYGDHNPGSANVFRAGGRKSGFLAVFLDIAKGFPFVALANMVFELPEVMLVTIAMSAVLGHAFSPLLQFRGGKSVAITFGVLLALPQREMLFSFTFFTVMGFLFLQNDGWTVVFGAIGSLIYLVITGKSGWEILLMAGILALFIVKQNLEIRTIPRFRVRLLDWYQPRR